MVQINESMFADLDNEERVGESWVTQLVCQAHREKTFTTLLGHYAGLPLLFEASELSDATEALPGLRPLLSLTEAQGLGTKRLSLAPELDTLQGLEDDLSTRLSDSTSCRAKPRSKASYG